jgi:hypothetical protein
MYLRNERVTWPHATIYRKLCLFWLCSHEKLQPSEKRELNLKEKEEVDTMITPLKMTLLSSMLVALLLPAVAQTSNAPTQNGAVPAQTTTPTQATTPAQSAPLTVQQRKENQQDRIANGVSSGQLSASETRNLEKKESQMNQEERDMKSEDNGHLSLARARQIRLPTLCKPRSDGK